jgi:hypothetical protein
MRFGRARDPVTKAVMPEPGTPFVGAHVFREGWFYPLLFDADGNDLGPNTNQPLVYKDGTLLHAEPTDLSHFHAYGLKEVELVPESEE